MSAGCADEPSERPGKEAAERYTVKVEPNSSVKCGQRSVVTHEEIRVWLFVLYLTEASGAEERGCAFGKSTFPKGRDRYALSVTS